MIKKILFLLTLLLTTKILSSQENKYYETNSQHTGTIKDSYNETVLLVPNGKKLLIRQKTNNDTISSYLCSSIDPIIRDGITKIFYESNILHYIKFYHDNKLDGQMTRFYKNGKIMSIITFDRDSILSKQSFNNKGQEIDYINDSSEPRFKNESINYFRRFFQNNITYPEEAMVNSKSARLTIKFTISESCKVENIEILGTKEPIFINEVVRVLMSTNGNWIPAMKFGEPFNYTFSMTTNFIVN
jgi:hypothetical protein